MSRTRGSTAEADRDSLAPWNEDEPPDHVVARLRHLETVFRLAPVGIGIVAVDGRVMLGNETLRLLLGYETEEFAAMPWWEFTHPDDVAPNLELFERSLRGEIDHFSMEKRFIRKDGSLMWAELTSSMVFDAEGRPEYAIGMIQDITERKRLETELSNAERHYRLLVERVPSVVYISDVGTQARWHYVSPQIENMLGFTAEEWLADPEVWYRQLHPEDRDRVDAAETAAAAAARPEEAAAHSSTYRMQHRDGSVVWVRDDAMALVEADGSVRWHGVLVDVTREKDLEARLGHQAFHDSLTGLPNRAKFGDEVARALGEGGEVAVMFVDLDRFKNINDSFGHTYGDKVLVAAARRIKGCVRRRDVAARLGGDEFAVLVRDARPERLVELAERILEKLRGTPMRFGELQVTVGASVGIAQAGPDDSADTLLRNADLAMYRAKRSGRGRHVHYHEALHDEVVGRFRMEGALQRAIEAQELRLVHQPIVDVRTGDVVGIEALARWDDPELGPVSPADFIPLAEQTGQIKPLGRQLLRDACAGVAAWRARTGADAYVSVNVSPLQLDDTFRGEVESALEAAGLDPGSLVLEVTESVLVDESHRAIVADLRTLGVRVAIDDFGTGYSSLAYLRDLPVDIIKIDRVFLRPGPGGPQDQKVLHALIRLAESLELPAVCEGVETRDQLEELRSAGCPAAQGYFLQRPGDLADVPARLDLAALA
ncbi:MAG TPA: EAL domain-containing protein [Nocardioides sp.]|nr:EAL domain-containing protein [Nocardioides sp.]